MISNTSGNDDAVHMKHESSIKYLKKCSQRLNNWTSRKNSPLEVYKHQNTEEDDVYDVKVNECDTLETWEGRAGQSRTAASDRSRA